MNVLLKDNIARHGTITETEFQGILSVATERQYKRGQFIVHEGSVVRKTCFILQGATISYFLDDKGDEHVIQFATEGWWISDIKSYISGTPAILNVKALEDCRVLEFSFENMQILYKKYPVLQSYFLNITQNAFATFQERILHNISLSAEERYKIFIGKYPKFEIRFPQKVLASYLGISAEFLSKIKKKLSLKS